MLDLLFVNWNVNPEIFHIGSFSIRWYSLLFISGFFIGWFIFKWFVRREGVPVSLLDPLLYTLLIATIVGARLGHCLFYQPDYYFGSWKGFWEIFMVWKGGLASHGGAIALILAMWWFSHHYGRKYDFDLLWILDRLCITVCFAGALIRFGNLFNSEIYGAVTDLPWGFKFVRLYPSLPVERIPVLHPAQLYEAICYVVTFTVLLWLYRRRDEGRRHAGLMFGVGLIGIFLTRFFIEFIKADQEAFEQGMALNMGQLLSIPFILLGAWMIWRGRQGRFAVAAPPSERAGMVHRAAAAAGEGGGVSKKKKSKKKW